MITSVAAAVAADLENSGQNFDPTWSPDGRKIAFVGDGKIYVMNADGSGKRRLTAGTAGTGARDFRPDGGPAWSPDGRKIAFGTLRHAGPFACSDGHPSAGCNWELYVMNADGSGQRRLTRDPAADGGATWSPDGRKLLFQSRPYRASRPKPGALPGFNVMNADGSGRRRLAAATGAAAWSPDGRMIAFSRGSGSARDVYVINADGSGQRRLTHSPGMDLQPTWSPDGRKIAFVSRRERCPSQADDRHAYVCRNAEIYVMNADGTGQRNLTRSPANGYYSSAVWSPDGRKMAFASDRDGNAEIYVMNADGSAQRRLTRNPASDVLAGWSPDGRKIAFVRVTDDLTFGSEIYVMNADGSGQMKLTP